MAPNCSMRARNNCPEHLEVSSILPGLCWMPVLCNNKPKGHNNSSRSHLQLTLTVFLTWSKYQLLLASFLLAGVCTKRGLEVAWRREGEVPHICCKVQCASGYMYLLEVQISWDKAASCWHLVCTSKSQEVLAVASIRGPVAAKVLSGVVLKHRRVILSCVCGGSRDGKCEQNFLILIKIAIRC